MDMIWHNDVTPEANSSPLTFLSETNQWWLIPLKDVMQSRRSIRHGGSGTL